MALTPANYFRVATQLSFIEENPPESVVIPVEISRRMRSGDGVLIADYDAETTTGLVRYLGLVTDSGTELRFNWKPVNCEIWVDTGPGRFNWARKPGFCFAQSKISSYGLHLLFAETFPQLEIREPFVSSNKLPSNKRHSRISPERLNPVEIIGEPTDSPRGGYIYALKSAYGYKIGRTKNIPSRMRAFGVHLPFIYSIEFCVWFDDHIEAETSYHRLFAGKRINGEWFDVSNDDLAKIRNREFSICY